MGFLRHCIVAGGLMLAMPSLAHSQSISEMVQTSQQQSAEIQQLMAALQTSDQVTQFKLVEALLAHEDKALVRIGREHALFSTNPVMQNVAIISTFTKNDYVRLTLSQPQSKTALTWVEHIGGTQDGTIGSVVLPTGEFDGNCWVAHFKSCRFAMVGTTVTFGYYANGGQSEQRAQSVMQLGTDGVLRGLILSSSGSATVEIDLKE